MCLISRPAQVHSYGISKVPRDTVGLGLNQEHHPSTIFWWLKWQGQAKVKKWENRLHPMMRGAAEPHYRGLDAGKGRESWLLLQSATDCCSVPA